MTAVSDREDLLCSICFELFSDPVTLKCQHTFCKKCIKKTWEKQTYSTACRCPLCNEEYTREPELNTTNPVIRALAEKAKANQTITEEDKDCSRKITAAGIETTDSGEERCGLHGELLQLLCISHDGKAICSQGNSKQHSQCQVVSLEEWKDKQEQIKEKITGVACRIKELERVVLQKQQEKNLLKERVSRAKASLTGEFAIMKQCILEQEKAVMKSIDAEGQSLDCRLHYSITKTNTRIEELKKIQAELEEKVKNNNWDLSQENSSAREMCEDDHSLETKLLFEQIDAIEDDVKKLISHIQESDLQKLIHLEKKEQPLVCSLQNADVSCTSESTSNHLKRKSAFQQYATKLTFDRTSNFKDLEISKDGRKVTVTSQKPCRKNPKRFKVSQVFCGQSFNSECHFWEVSTKHCDKWAVGIAYKSLGQWELLGRNKKSWCLELGDRDFSVWHDHQETIKDCTKPTVVGLFLNYNDGLLKFYSVDETECQLLHVFETEFTESVCPAFWLYGLTKGNYLELIDMEKD